MIKTMNQAMFQNIVNQHFNEFVQWAYDDFVINELEQETLTNSNDRDIHERIRMEVVKEFQMILKMA
jgi:hypothetical protein